MDKFFGYSTFVIKFFIRLFMFFSRKNSSKIVPIYIAGIHFLKKKYGDYDRENYQNIDSFLKSTTRKHL